ncbi:MAG: hypothetical protein ABIY51_04385 [Ferruginibacter sp.]
MRLILFSFIANRSASIMMYLLLSFFSIGCKYGVVAVKSRCHSVVYNGYINQT